MNLPLTDIIPRCRRMLAEPGAMRGVVTIAVIVGLIEGAALSAVLPTVTALATDGAVWGLGLAGWLWTLAGLSLASFAANYFSNRWGYGIALDFLRNIHRLVGDRVARQPLGWFARPLSGKLSRIVSSELMTTGEIIAHMIVPLISRIAAAGVIIVASWFWDPLLGLVLTVAVPVFACLTMASTALMRRSTNRTEPVQERLADRIVEFAQCQGALRSCGRSRDFTPLTSAMEDARSAKMRSLGTETGGLLLSGAATQGVVVILISVTGSLAVSGTLDPVPALAFIGLAMRFTSTLSAITESAMGIEGRRPVLDGIDGVLTAEPLAEPSSPATLTDPGAVSLQNVTFGYSPESPVLQDVSIDVPASTMVALVGPSGSGKTTVARLVSRFYDVDAGVVRVGGVPVTAQTTTQLMSQLSMVFQDVYLFDDTLLENIRVGREDATDEEVIDAATLAGVSDIASRLTDGWDAPVGEGGRALSGGERQRVAIARALLKRAPIVLLDEATSALDVENEANILAAVDELRTHATVITIAHRLDTIAAADVIVQLDGSGRVEASGTHAELMALDATYARYWRHLHDAQGWKLVE
ncbi:MAG: ABC transporter ATP-binding protein [Corynebacterium sp.]|uniref:ABC transporter ATP-binding protein n=1 Tax=Corynebacterium sp. TaxID=1720 RepID=UPI003F970881